MKHFARLGGMIIAPRRTLQHMLKTKEGSLWEVLFWLVVVTAAISPTSTGRAVLLGRVEFFSGVLTFLNVVSTRMIVPLIATLIAAILLFAAARLKHPPHDSFRFDVLLDTAAFCLVPFLLLAALGAVLLHFGLELWFMPHRKINGTTWPYWVRGTVAFAWSFGLFALLWRTVWLGPAHLQPDQVDVESAPEPQGENS